MSKITKRKQVKTLLFIMANMSASIIRELVGTEFNISPSLVILSGEMPLTWGVSGASTSGCAYTDQQWNVVWAFKVEEGFIKVKEQIRETEAAQNADGSWVDAYGYTAEQLAKEAPNALFFVVNEGRYYNDCNNRTENENSWTLYKAPDFKDYWAKVEETDIQRWKSWILDAHIENNPTGHFADARAKGLI